MNLYGDSFNVFLDLRPDTIYVVFPIKDRSMSKDLFESFRVHEDFLDEFTIGENKIFKFSFSSLYLEDFDLFLNGKYSHFSEEKWSTTEGTKYRQKFSLKNH